MADRKVPPSHKRAPWTGLPNRNPMRSPHGTRAVERMLAERADKQREGAAGRRTTRP
jgi:hypothetical protein